MYIYNTLCFIYIYTVCVSVYVCVYYAYINLPDGCSTYQLPQYLNPSAPAGWWGCAWWSQDPTPPRQSVGQWPPVAPFGAMNIHYHPLASYFGVNYKVPGFWHVLTHSRAIGHSFRVSRSPSNLVDALTLAIALQEDWHWCACNPCRARATSWKTFRDIPCSKLSCTCSRATHTVHTAQKSLGLLKLPLAVEKEFHPYCFMNPNIAFPCVPWSCSAEGQWHVVVLHVQRLTQLHGQNWIPHDTPNMGWC